MFIPAYAFAGLFALGGLGMAILNFISDGPLAAVFPLFFGLVGSGLLYSVRLQHMRMRKMKANDYAWYRRTYPQTVKGNAISCNQCGGHRVHVRALLQRTYMREHFCPQCGTTLYYSPEPR
jgi:uncharacterized paraquat-inducible protein A